MEYTWKQFIELKEIRKLPLQEQVKRYSFYLEELSSTINIQSKGDGPFLLTEDGRYLLLENFNRIILNLR